MSASTGNGIAGGGRDIPPPSGPPPKRPLPPPPPPRSTEEEPSHTEYLAHQIKGGTLNKPGPEPSLHSRYHAAREDRLQGKPLDQNEYDGPPFVDTADPKDETLGGKAPERVPGPSREKQDARKQKDEGKEAQEKGAGG